MTGGGAGFSSGFGSAFSSIFAAGGNSAAAKAGVLMVVGSLAEASRQQAGALKDSGGVSAIVVAPETLLAGAQASAWKASADTLSQALAAGRPVLLQIGLSGSPDLAMGGALVASLAELVERVAPRIGSIVATGGETACAVLARLGVTGIRLIDEVEPGVPLGLTLGARSFPVVTKAGAFGDAETLGRCLRRLEQATLVPA